MGVEDYLGERVRRSRHIRERCAFCSHCLTQYCPLQEKRVWIEVVMWCGYLEIKVKWETPGMRGKKDAPVTLGKKERRVSHVTAETSEALILK